MTSETLADAADAAEAQPTELSGAKRIPIRNVWLLMLYASVLYRDYSDHLKHHSLNDVENKPDDIVNLVAQVLANAVERRLKRNLSFSFRRREADMRRVRGRIDLLRTERRGLLEKGLVACRFDELTVDTPPNRLVMAALKEAARMTRDRQLAARCHNAAAALERMGVSPDPVLDDPRDRADALRAVRRQPHREDRLMLAAAELVFDLTIPTERAGASRMFSVERDDAWLRMLFEKAVAGFYTVALDRNVWNVGAGKTIQWQTSNPTDGLSKVLPSMILDIVLEHRDDGRRIVIDTKFTDVVHAGRYRPKSLRSGYIYQIYAYVRSQERADDPASKTSEGILLHPAIGEDVDEWADIQGHRFRFATVDLNADSPSIRNRLMDIVRAGE